MKKFIIANWKMNPQTLAEAKRIFNATKLGVKNIRNIEVVICPPFVCLDNLQQATGNLKLGAQNCFFEEKGAFTGEISPLILKDLGVEYVILGHSERRRIFNEDDEIINKKIKLVLKEKLKPIFCIGENQKQKNQEKTFEVLKKQVLKGLTEVSRKLVKNLIIAYEPVWAIGSGKSCQSSYAQTVNIFLKKIISQKYGRKTAQTTPILYGGSVNSENVLPYFQEAGMVGVLVGGASLNTKEFIKIIKTVSKA